jgi:hypothetical protein
MVLQGQPPSTGLKSGKSGLEDIAARVVPTLCEYWKEREDTWKKGKTVCQFIYLFRAAVIGACKRRAAVSGEIELIGDRVPTPLCIGEETNTGLLVRMVISIPALQSQPMRARGSSVDDQLG